MLIIIIGHNEAQHQSTRTLAHSLTQTVHSKQAEFGTCTVNTGKIIWVFTTEDRLALSHRHNANTIFNLALVR